MPLTNLHYCRPLRYVEHVEELAFENGATAIQTLDERDRLFGAYRVMIYFPERLTVLAVIESRWRNEAVRIASREYDGPEDEDFLRDVMEGEPLPALLASWLYNLERLSAAREARWDA